MLVPRLNNPGTAKTKAPTLFRSRSILPAPPALIPSRQVEDLLDREYYTNKRRSIIKTSHK